MLQCNHKLNMAYGYIYITPSSDELGRGFKSLRTFKVLSKVENSLVFGFPSRDKPEQGGIFVDE